MWPTSNDILSSFPNSAENGKKIQRFFKQKIELQDPPSDAEYPAEIAEKFDDGQPWYNATDELPCGELCGELWMRICNIH